MHKIKIKILAEELFLFLVTQHLQYLELYENKSYFFIFRNPFLPFLSQLIPDRIRTRIGIRNTDQKLNKTMKLWLFLPQIGSTQFVDVDLHDVAEVWNIFCGKKKYKNSNLWWKKCAIEVKVQRTSYWTWSNEHVRGNFNAESIVRYLQYTGSQWDDRMMQWLEPMGKCRQPIG